MSRESQPRAQTKSRRRSHRSLCVCRVVVAFRSITLNIIFHYTLRSSAGRPCRISRARQARRRARRGRARDARAARELAARGRPAVFRDVI